MELIRYLESRFLTREQLLAHCAPSTLERLQLARVMPMPSYRVRLDLGCASFFGEHAEQLAVDYYATGYVGWLALAQTLGSEEQARTVFFERYRARVKLLATADGLVPADPAFVGDAHLQAEWKGFLDGTYGACTTSGLPEEIAEKEAAVALIRELTANAALDEFQRDRLRRAVNLLDRAASPFAPHEAARSSRRRYVDEVRTAYGFTPPASASPSTGQPCLQSRSPADLAS